MCFLEMIIFPLEGLHFRPIYPQQYICRNHNNINLNGDATRWVILFQFRVNVPDTRSIRIHNITNLNSSLWFYHSLPWFASIVRRHLSHLASLCLLCIRADKVLSHRKQLQCVCRRPCRRTTPPLPPNHPLPTTQLSPVNWQLFGQGAPLVRPVF